VKDSRAVSGAKDSRAVSGAKDSRAVSGAKDRARSKADSGERASRTGSNGGLKASTETAIFTGNPGTETRSAGMAKGARVSRLYQANGKISAGMANGGRAGRIPVMDSGVKTRYRANPRSGAKASRAVRVTASRAVFDAGIKVRPVVFSEGTASRAVFDAGIKVRPAAFSEVTASRALSHAGIKVRPAALSGERVSRALSRAGKAKQAAIHAETANRALSSAGKVKRRRPAVSSEGTAKRAGFSEGTEALAAPPRKMTEGQVFPAGIPNRHLGKKMIKNRRNNLLKMTGSKSFKRANKYA
ncbi:MAG: hypothetical protein LBB94_07070, partial [Clostridiales bacterium]|nr:hypothetical protein [Clostridiales bacterium]